MAREPDGREGMLWYNQHYQRAKNELAFEILHYKLRMTISLGKVEYPLKNLPALNPQQHKDPAHRGIENQPISRINDK